MPTPLTQAQITNDPRVQAILRDPSLSVRDKTLRLGWLRLPIPDGYYLSAMGTLEQKGPWWEKYIGPAVVAGGGIGALALGAGGAAAAAGSAAPAASTGTITGTTLGTGMAATAPTLGGIGAPGAIAAAAPAASQSIWGKLAPSLLNIGANAVGGYFQSRAAGKAADQQAAAADKALALQRDIWNQSQANQAPYMQTGSQAITRLNGLMGGTPIQQPQSLANLQPQAPQQPQMVNMKAPDGSVKAVPYTDVAHYTQLGAQRIF